MFAALLKKLSYPGKLGQPLQTSNAIGWYGTPFPLAG